MGARCWGRWLFLLAAAAIVALMAGLVWDGLRQPRGADGWDGPVSESSLLLIPALFYIALALMLFALNVDLAQAAPARGDLARLLILKRALKSGGGLTVWCHRGRGARPRQWRSRTALRPVLASTQVPGSVLDRLVSLKRRGA